MIGAESLVKTLLASGVEVCFSNPGTSEMHFVSALDRNEDMRCVLGLFEGVVTGAADGYARIAGKPAATLLHLGAGLGNGLANLHNARRGHVPVVNVVGNHATYHLKHDAPLTSDIEGIAAPVSGWVRSSASADQVGADAAQAVAEAQRAPGRVATLILPADVSWEDAGDSVATPVAIPAAPVAPPERIEQAATAVAEGDSTMVFLGGSLGRSDLELASRICRKTGARLCCETFTTKQPRGAGVVPIERLPYLAELAIEYLKDVRRLVLVGCEAPVSFFAYPNVPGTLWPQDCEVVRLASRADDVTASLEALLTATRAEDVAPELAALSLPELPQGRLNTESVADAIAALLPDDAIIVDEGITSSLSLYGRTAGARAHDFLTLTGGSIGWGLPAAVGAAIAAPQRRVLCLEGDGSAMYTIQALWTMARENLDVTTVIFSNRDYAVLQLEYMRVGAEGMGKNARDMMAIGRPDMDFVAMAQSMGVAGSRAASAEEFSEQLGQAFASRGPRLIEAMMPTITPGDWA